MQMLRLKSLLWAVLLLPLASQAGDVSEFQLDNGLKLIVKEDHRAPVVVSQVWYKVGASYEPNGITGISHQLEHMMFKGTKNLKPNEFSQIIAANGGQENAFTGQDYTAYFQTLEKDRLPVSFRLEAERMRNLQIDEAELLKERDVVAEERRMRTEDNPHALVNEAFHAAAFMNSPYHHPIIGWMSDINHYQADELRDWYQKWYAPNNATVVVVGDVKAQAVLELAKQYFGPLKPEKIADLKPQVEVPQKGYRYVQVKAPAELPYLMMGWKVPVVTTAEVKWEPYALDVLAGILDGGSSARFSRELVRGQEVASGVYAQNNLFSRLQDVFQIGGTPAKGKTVAELKAAIMEQLKQLKTGLVSAQELQRVKAQVVASNVYERDSVFYQAMQIGMLETVGLDWRLSDDYVANINKVTAEQIQAVVQKYFIDDKLTVAELDPQPVEGRQIRQSTGARHVR
jgi:zinc protease